MDESLVRACCALRRELHAHPEAGFEETWTQARLRAALVDIAGVDAAAIAPCARTGLVVDIDGPGAPARRIALRADMDALRMQEANPRLPYRRRATASTCAATTATWPPRRRGAPRAAARPAPAGRGRAPALPAGRGGRALRGRLAPRRRAADDPRRRGVDEIYGLHNLPTAPVGAVRVKAGAVMGRSSELRISVTGAGGHRRPAAATISESF
ncbi:IAA-amino acid conjugate hydrolase [Aureococcus anophagefferens]|nr:IAA-amino acid conjugate hydrolase [Aureococcus anophagefferens]